jgi:hypothetical protein
MTELGGPRPLPHRTAGRPVAAPPLSFVVRGPIARDDLAGLSERVCALFGGLTGSAAQQNSTAQRDDIAPQVVHCEVSTVAPDAVTIEALARLKLVAQRAGCTVRLCHASDELIALVAFLGLSDVLTC